MKKIYLAAILVVAGTLCAKSQTKGTNALGFGVTKTDLKWSSSPGNDQEQKFNSYGITYGHFIKDNTRLGLTLNFSKNNSEFSNGGYSSEAKGYGGNINYQKYYPLLKNFYAFAGGRGGYFYEASDYTYQSGDVSKGKASTYSIGANGGLSYFAFKRFALEAILLKADFSYSDYSNKGSGQSTEQSSLQISSSGLLSNLGFNIYFLF